MTATETKSLIAAIKSGKIDGAAVLAIIDAEIAKRKTFTLIACPALPFKLVRRFTNVAGIDCVAGVTFDGKRQTVARFVDVVFA